MPVSLVLAALTLAPAALAGNGIRVDRGSALVQLRGAPLLTGGATTGTKARIAATQRAFARWLRAHAPSAKVTARFDIALNAVAVRLNGTKAATLRRAPMVAKVEFEDVYAPRGHADPDLALISALQAWELGPGGPEMAGDGVKVAIIDTGIDVRHPCFDDAGYPESNNLGPDNEVNGGTNDKVIYAEVFNNKAGNRGWTTADEQGHGTHVAGTVACNMHTPAWIESSGQVVDIPYDPSGVAPRALLGNFTVFPGPVESARSEDILNALERAFELGFDVANMSLGGNSNGIQDLLTHAIARFDRAGMVVAVAAGNSGPGDETIESPGSGAGTIAAGASTVGHFVGAPVSAPGVSALAASGEFETVESDLTAPLEVVESGGTGVNPDIGLGCTEITEDLTGTIALIQRGSCTFSTKIRNAKDAGARAVLIVNNVAGDPTAMASDGTPDQPMIPAYMVGKDVGAALVAHEGENVMIGATLEYQQTGNDNIMAGFSSEGPTDVDFRVKPDVVAPGVNVLSSQPAWTCDEMTPSCWAFFSGTSMATPHIAGTAAVALWEHPDWEPWQVRSAIVNTAVRGVLLDSATGTEVVDNPNVVGAGLENVLNAVTAHVALNPVSISFGGLPSGSGQTRRGDVLIENVTASTLNLTFSLSGPAASLYSVTPSSVTLVPGQSTTVTLTLTGQKKMDAGDEWAWLEIESGGTNVAHAAIYTRVK